MEGDLHRGDDGEIAATAFYRAMAADDVERAGELARAGMELHRRSQLVAQPEGVPIAESRLAEAGSPVSESHVALARTHANPAFRALTGHVLAESGRIEEVVAVLGNPVPDEAWDHASVVGDCLRVDVLAHGGPSDALSQAFDRITPWSQEFAVYGSIDYIEYFICRGLEGQGDLVGARAAYTRAVERNRAARVVPWRRRAEQRRAALVTTGR